MLKQSPTASVSFLFQSGLIHIHSQKLEILRKNANLLKSRAYIRRWLGSAHIFTRVYFLERLVFGKVYFSKLVVGLDNMENALDTRLTA